MQCASWGLTSFFTLSRSMGKIFCTKASSCCLNSRAGYLASTCAAPREDSAVAALRFGDSAIWVIDEYGYQVRPVGMAGLWDIVVGVSMRFGHLVCQFGFDRNGPGPSLRMQACSPGLSAMYMEFFMDQGSTAEQLCWSCQASTSFPYQGCCCA